MLFVNHLQQNPLLVSHKKYHYDYILTYLKHFSNNNITFIHLLKKKTANDYDERFIKHTPKKYIKWLTS